MARLNEAPPAQESVEALKRRFIRQNRELAKNNSNQSIRIRSLESEQSRLLAENLDLREQILHLRNQVESNHSPVIVSHVDGIKDKLEAKIQELGGLVAELSILQNPASARTVSEPPRPQSKSNEYYEWRRAAKEEMEVEESMPTIKEDKYYPRRTLDAEEIRAVLMDTSNGSPDLGPPPVAHFPDEEPIKFKSQAETSEDRDQEMGEDNDLPILSVNLETRKKRRDSTKLDLRKMTVFQSPPEESDCGAKSESDAGRRVRTGAKRKLKDAMEEHAEETADTKPADEFRFSRRASSDAERTGVSRQEKGQSKLDMLVAAERKALGDKTNTSPKKISKISPTDSKPDSKKSSVSSTTNRARTRDRKSRTVTVPTDSIEPTPPVVESIEPPPEEPEQPTTLPPKTPATAPSSTISPPSQPTTNTTNDTPPPVSITTTSTTTDPSQPSRLARRARPTVNYAEPNLVSKMRRPTKDLAPAVDDRRSTSADILDGGNVGTSGTGKTPGSGTVVRTVVIKRERFSGGFEGGVGEGEDAWKSLPIAEAQPVEADAVDEIKLEQEQQNSPTPLTGKMAGMKVSTQRDELQQQQQQQQQDTQHDQTQDPDLDPAAIMKRSRDLVKSRTASSSSASRRHSSIVGAVEEKGAAEDVNSKSRVGGREARGVRVANGSANGLGSAGGEGKDTASARLAERRSDRADRAGRRRSMML